MQQKPGPEVYPYSYVQYYVQHNILIKMMLKKYKILNIILKYCWLISSWNDIDNIEFKILLKIIHDNRIILRWVHAWGMWGKVGRKGGHYRTYCDLLLICRGPYKIPVCCVLQCFPYFSFYRTFYILAYIVRILSVTICPVFCITRLIVTSCSFAEAHRLYNVVLLDIIPLFFVF